MECPKCRDIDKIEFISKNYCESGIEYQLICKNCGNVIRGYLDYNEL
jgi:uncharacterized Zn finger protein